MEPTLTVLGAGSILPRAGFGCAGYALREGPGPEVTLLDCGPGSVRMLGPVGIDLEQVRRVLISHFHVDHCLDLLALSFARRNPGLLRRPRLELIGPVGLRALLDGAAAAFGRQVVDPDAVVREVALDGAGQGELDVEGARLACVATGHRPEALAWRLDLAAGASLAFTGDTGENPAVADCARGVDLFVSECSHADGSGQPHHLTPARAGRLAARAGARRLLLSHFYPGLEPEDARRAAALCFPGPIETARDGSEHRLTGGSAGS